jgi:uncharacterized protein (TIGR02270 family)
MATSTHQFNIELYLEHLDESSFLYQQRLAYLHDPEVNWPDLANCEDRFEAHIDALVVGEELALEVCRRRAAEGDAGEKHAALRVFCRQDRKDDAFAMLETLDSSDKDVVRAVSQALRSEAPSGWRDDLLKLFESDRAHLTHVLAEVIGYRRFRYEEQVLRKLAGRPQFGTAEIAWALGRVGTPRSIPALSGLLDSDHEPTVDAAAIALLRLGDDRVLDRAMREAPRRAWARRTLGIGGGPRAVRVLLDTLKTEGPDTDTVLALGLLGDLAAVMPLVNLLEDGAVGATAAVALNTITGAGLYGSTFVPDQFDVDELSAEEREAYDRDGTVPTRNGEPYGNWEHGPVRDQAGWTEWLDKNKQSFSRESRWRMGRPHGPSALCESLRSPTSSYAVRTASYEELVVRYRLDIPFEVELRVKQQLRFMQDIAHWEAKKGPETRSGGWFFADRPQP